MNLTSKRRLLVAVAIAAAIGNSTISHAQDNKPITILVPQQAGTIQDLVARSLGDELTKALKQPVIVENRPGASQIVASSALARSAPDGHTLMVSAMPNTIAPKLLQNLPYSGNQDFTVIAYSLDFAGILAVSPQVPASNLKEFIALLKAEPDKYMYGSAGVGTPLHMFLEQFNRDAGTQSRHIPYKTFQAIIPDVSTNQVHYSFLPISLMPMAKEGKIKVLGFAGPKRDAQYPDVPTLDEQGLKGFDASIHYFLIGPKGMPAELVGKLNEAVNAIQTRESYQTKFKVLGGATVPQNFSPAAAAAIYRRDDERYLPLIKEGRIAFE